ncbi:NADH-quinone oxidoreductase subunit L [Salininema proteolyticum]|uniref:NADH-quinone oxidoreductase subunit L n=1 Tax=Salininema proteolyticum TaxID=1607685 RepID=A0ABV8TXN2_9ACTN
MTAQTLAHAGMTYSDPTGILAHTWLLIALPAFGAAVLLLTGKAADRWGHWLGVATVAAAFGLGLAQTLELAGLDAKSVHTDLYTFLSVGGTDMEASLLFDPLSAAFVLLITGVGALIHLYAVGYMSHDPDRRKFFAYFNLFVAAMLVLVLGGNYLMTFIGWEGVGLASYLLISFWQWKPAAATAGKKAFLANRVADVGFLIALFAMVAAFGTLDFSAIEADASGLSTGMALLIGLSLLAAACGKSGQFPFQTWLPDAMEGPTPVSALIHAATMVTAGVYLIARSHVLFSLNETVQLAVVSIGALTLLFGAIVGCAKDDIKRVLAWSTVSQIGYMFLAVGLGGGAIVLGLVHLLAHGFFKANLFLGSGSVMHAMNDQTDIRRFGGLWRKMPWTYATFAAGWLAIIGMWPASGYFSKDPIIYAAFAEGGVRGWILGGAALLGAALTAFYMTRLFVLTFHGPKRWTEDVHPHESPAVMVGPLVVLGIGSLGGGYLLYKYMPAWFEPVFAANPETIHGPLSHLQVTVMTMVAVVGSAALAWWYFRSGTDEAPQPASLPVRAARADLGGELVNKALFERPSVFTARASVAFDARGIDGIVNGLSAAVGGISRRALGLQTGYVRSYALSVLSGAVLVLAGLMVVIFQ